MSPSNDPTSATGTLQLPARVDAAVAAALYRQWRARSGALQAIDMQAVRAIDSAGVALVHQLQADALRAHGTHVQLLHASDAYRQVCRAHRLQAEGA